MDNGVDGQGDVEEDAEWVEIGCDEMDICLPVKCAFDGEEAESEPEPSIKEGRKSIVQPGNGDALSSTGASEQVTTVEKPFSSHPIKAEASARKQPHSQIVHMNKNSQKESVSGKEIGSSGSQSKDSDVELQSPICCVLSNVDTGKTNLLDCIRGTEVQKGEAGGITQQIGATYIPAVNIRERTKELKADAKLLVPGLLVIDTPGHESFTNLRSRGSDLCDIAILVVDIMHGLQPQTIESIDFLKTRNIEFIVALNKIDRLYGWKKCPNAPFIKSMKEQSKQVVQLFNSKVQDIIGMFMVQGLNAALYYKNKEMGGTFNIVPTSAISGEGIPDLLVLLAQWTQKTMVEKLTFSNKVQCTVLEVKETVGYGTTIDVILVNGVRRRPNCCVRHAGACCHYDTSFINTRSDEGAPGQGMSFFLTCCAATLSFNKVEKTISVSIIRI